MAANLKHSVQISAYIDPKLKARMVSIRKLRKRETVSKLVEDALMYWLPIKEGTAKDKDSER